MTHSCVPVAEPFEPSRIKAACAEALRFDGPFVPLRRIPRLLDELALAKVDGTYAKTLRKLARTQVLIVDDFGLGRSIDARRHDLLEVRRPIRLPGHHHHEPVTAGKLA